MVQTPDSGVVIDLGNNIFAFIFEGVVTIPISVNSVLATFNNWNLTPNGAGPTNCTPLAIYCGLNDVGWTVADGILQVGMGTGSHGLSFPVNLLQSQITISVTRQLAPASTALVSIWCVIIYRK